MRKTLTLIAGCVLVIAGPAHALLPVCEGGGTNALTTTSDSVYAADDRGMGLTLSGTAEAKAVAVRIALNGTTLLESTLSGDDAQQAWQVAVDAADIEAQPDGPLTFAATVLRADGSPVDAGQLVVTKNFAPPAAVTDFVATGSSGIVTLSWALPSDDDLARIRILRSADRFADDAHDSAGQIVVHDGPGTSVVDASVTAGTWFWTAFALDTAGNESPRATTTLEVESVATQVSFADDFDGCSDTDGAGGAWTTDGRWYCRSDRVRCETADGVALAPTLPLGEATVTARVSLTGSDSGSGLVARFANGAGYLARILPGRGLELVRLGGSPTLLAFQPSSIPHDSTHALELRVTGDGPVTLTARVDDEPPLQVVDTDGALSAGYAGLYSGTDWRTQFDDFTLSGFTAGASTPPPPPPPPDPPTDDPPELASFADDFDGCTSTDDLGGRWETDGTWYCRSDRARGESHEGLALVSGTLPADVTVSTRMKLTGRDGSGVVSRWRDGSGYLLRLRESRVELVRLSSGGQSVLAQVAIPPPETSFHPLALRVSGESPVRLEAHYEGGVVLTHEDFAPDAPAGAGRVGLWSGSDDRTQFDHLFAEP